MVSCGSTGDHKSNRDGVYYPQVLGGVQKTPWKSHLGEVRQDADRQPQDLESFTRVRGLGALGFPS